MLLLGASLDSEQALRAGLASRVFGSTSDEFKKEMRSRARRFEEKREITVIASGRETHRGLVRTRPSLRSSPYACAVETADKLKSNENSARSKDLIADAMLLGRGWGDGGGGGGGGDPGSTRRRDRLRAVNEREARVLAERLVSQEAMESLRRFLGR